MTRAGPHCLCYCSSSVFFVNFGIKCKVSRYKGKFEVADPEELLEHG